MISIMDIIIYPQSGEILNKTMSTYIQELLVDHV